MTDAQRAVAIGNAIEHLHCADYPEYRLAVTLLCGCARKRIYPRTWRARIRDAWRELVRPYGIIEHHAP